MKKIILFAALFVFVLSCKKGSVPQICQNYVGEWHGAKSSTATQYLLTIKGDGTASYTDPNGNGSGPIHFEGYNFYIGKKRKSVKFKTDSVPHRVTITVNPYTYYQRATFNGVTYSDRPQ